MDAVPCVTSVECYSVSYSLKLLANGYLVTKLSDGYIKRDSDNKYLIKKYSTVDEYAFHTDVVIVNNAIARAGNGIYYDAGASRRTYSSANSYCTSKGMRIPRYSETSRSNSTYVPNYTGETWYDTSSSTCKQYGWWSSGTDVNNDCSTTNYVRCVK